MQRSVLAMAAAAFSVILFLPAAPTPVRIRSATNRTGSIGGMIPRLHRAA